MSKIIQKRLRFMLFGVVASLIIGLLYIFQRQVLIVSLENEINSLLADPVISKQLEFGDFSTQTVDDYLANLADKIKQLKIKIEANDVKLRLAELDSTIDVSEVKRQTTSIQTELDRYLVDQEFMNYASVDYRLFVLQPIFKLLIDDLLKTQVQLAFEKLPTKTLENQGEDEDETVKTKYVKAGQVLGVQGCSGVCSGTHLHFVVLVDDSLVNPCTFLPSKQMSRWGVASECGQPTGGEFLWPLPIPWIVTQNFGEMSPVTRTPHEGIDLIDREFAPVLAAHDGWYFFKERDCRGAYICNDGASKIAIVCENLDCKVGLRTEYWHLDWMLEI